MQGMSPVASVCVCSDYFTVDEGGELCLKAGSMGLREVVHFTEPGVHQFRAADYPWLARVRVQCQGGGGGAAGAVAGDGECIARPGAAGGAWAQSLLEVGVLGAVETVVVGAGGTGGAGNNGGSAGGASSFGGFVMAPGGLGASPNMASGVDPQTASGPPGASGGTGDLLIGGGAGGSSLRLNGSKGVSGDGGDSHLGHGGKGIRIDGGGDPPTGYGAGASGAFSVDRSAQTGVDGGPGIVIIELYG